MKGKPHAFAFRNITLQNYSTTDKPLFRPSDVLDLLECPEGAMWEIDDDEIVDDSHGRRWISEPGLYHLLLQSEAPVAQDFRRWTQGVATNIALTGKHNVRAVLN